MRKWLWLLFILEPYVVSAQTWDEFFKQKKTQKKYLLEQLVALKLYAGYVVKGYQTVHSGLSTIRDLTGGELSLHDLFIASQNSPGPLIRNNARVGRIILLQLRIRARFNDLGQLDLPDEQRQYVGSVREKVLKDCAKDLDELVLVLGSGDLEMDDFERMAMLDRIHAAMEDKWQFTGSFTSGVRHLMLMKQQTLRDAEAGGKIHGVTD